MSTFTVDAKKHQPRGRLRVAVLTVTFPAPSETFILSQVVGAIERGVDLRVLARYADDAAKLTDAQRELVQDRVMYSPPAPHGPHRWYVAAHFLSRVMRAGKGVAQIGRPLHLIGRLREAIGGHTLQAWVAGTMLKQSGRYDAYHAHYGPLGQLVAGMRAIDALYPDIPLITSFHGFDMSQYVQEKGAEVYARLFDEGEVFTVNSNYTRERLIMLGCRPERIVLLPMSVDPQAFAFRERTLPPSEPVHILTVARLVEKKGLEYAIRAVAAIAKHHPNVRFRIAGDGPLRDELRALIDSLGCSEHIILLGWRNPQEVRELLAASHLFVLSSVTAMDGDTEGQGVALLEAQACGLPVVATRHNGFPDSVREGESALLVPERDVDALRDALEALLREPARWPAMGAAGRAHVERNFDATMLNDRLVELYRIAAEHGVGAAAVFNERFAEASASV